MAKALVLRTCNADLTSRGGFQWPESGAVSAPDWSPEPICGYGLHGALWGEGDGSLFSWEPDTKWLVVEVESEQCIDLGGKVKFPAGVVMHCGDRISATEYLAKRAPGRSIIGGTSTSGYGGTSTSGDYGTSTSGCRGTSTSGDYGTSTSGGYGTSASGYGGTSASGCRGTSASGYGGTSASGYGGTSTSGDRGTSISGSYGTSISGYRGTSTSGDNGTSTSGDNGTSTSGSYGTSISGDNGTSTSGEGGILVCRWWDEKAERYRLTVGYVGENGILPNTAYKADESGKLVEVKPTATNSEPTNE